MGPLSSRYNLRFPSRSGTTTSSSGSSPAGSSRTTSPSSLAGLTPYNRDVKRRRRLTPYETDLLSQVFEHCPRPNTTIREQLAIRLGMTARGIQIWFQNRRAKVKRDVLESGHTAARFPPADYGQSGDEDGSRDNDDFGMPFHVHHQTNGVAGQRRFVDFDPDNCRECWAQLVRYAPTAKPELSGPMCPADSAVGPPDFDLFGNPPPLPISPQSDANFDLPDNWLQKALEVDPYDPEWEVKVGLCPQKVVP